MIKLVEIRIKNLLKVFGSLHAVDNLNHTFNDGKVTCLLGPSGCGKTTLLRMIAGLESQTAGSIFFGNKEVTNTSTRDRNIGMVFQYPVVYKGLSVYKNIELPLLKENLTKGDIKERVDSSIELLNLGNLRNREASTLGMVLRQKVAVAREIARRLDIILFDEPLTNLDVNSKTQFKRSFKELTQHLKQTIVYVTHDQTEAMTFADYIALMLDGKIVQYDKPRELYNKPKDRFGGWFLGNPGMNFFTPKVEKKGESMFISSPLLENSFKTNTGKSIVKNMTLGIRPEHIVVRNEPFADNNVKVTLKQKWITTGGQYLLTAEMEDTVFRIKVDPDTGKNLHDLFYCQLPTNKIMAYDSNCDSDSN